MTTREWKRRLDAATNLNACRPGDREYLVICPTRGEFRWFGANPQGAMGALDKHSDDGRMYEGCRVIG